MGLESHIRQVLEDNAGDGGRLRYLDYWFENGLKADDERAARRIAKTLNESGEFGKATALYSLSEDAWCVLFDIHPQFKRK